MMVLGLLLLAAGVAFGVDFVYENTFQTPTPVAFGQSLGVHTAWWVFVIGAIAGAAALLGLSLLVAGAGRSTARASRRRAERQDMAAATTERDRLAAENERLRAERMQAGGPVTTTAPVAGTASYDGARDGRVAEREVAAGEPAGAYATRSERLEEREVAASDPGEYATRGERLEEREVAADEPTTAVPAGHRRMFGR